MLVNELLYSIHLFTGNEMKKKKKRNTRYEYPGKQERRRENCSKEIPGGFFLSNFKIHEQCMTEKQLYILTIESFVRTS